MLAVSGPLSIQVFRPPDILLTLLVDLSLINFFLLKYKAVRLSDGLWFLRLKWRENDSMSISKSISEFIHEPSLKM